MTDLNNKVKAIVFNPKTGESTRVLLGRDERGSLLPSIYSILDCSMIEHTYVIDDIGAYVNEEGLLEEDPIFGVVYLDKDYEVSRALAGKILFVNHDIQGETIDLTDQQIHSIERLNVGQIGYKNGDVYTAITLHVDERLVS